MLRYCCHSNLLILEGSVAYCSEFIKYSIHNQKACCILPSNMSLHFLERWNKKLNYVIGIAKDGVHDVTKRYTRKWPEVHNLILASLTSALLAQTREFLSTD